MVGEQSSYTPKEMRRVGSQKVLSERKNTINTKKNVGNYNLQLPLELIQEKVKAPTLEAHSQRNSSRFRQKPGNNQNVYFKNEDQQNGGFENNYK